MCFHLQITGSCTFFYKRSCGLRPLWLQQFMLNLDQCLDCVLHRSHWVAIFLPSRTQKGHPVIQKASNAALFFTHLYIISAPPVHLMICRMRPVTPPPPFICATGGPLAGAAAGGGAAAESGTGAAAEATTGRGRGRRSGTEVEAGTPRETGVKRGQTRRGELAFDTRSHVRKQTQMRQIW